MSGQRPKGRIVPPAPMSMQRLFPGQQGGTLDLTVPFYQMYIGMGIDLRQLDECVANIKSPELAPVAKVFDQNITAAIRLLSVPHNFVSTGRYYALLDDAIQRSVAQQPQIRTEAEQSIIAQRTADEFKKRYEQQPLQERMDIVSDYLQSLLNNESSESAATVRTLLLTTITMTWTAFECVVTDVWVAALNTQQGLGQAAFKDLDPDENPGKPNSRTIPLELLKKYQFNLSNVLGTTLRSSFDFTRIEGIQRAYRAAFGKTHIKTLDATFQDKQLKDLHALRNLIVHRAGVVDEEFLKRTTLPNNTIGDEVYIQRSLVDIMVEAAIKNGVELLTFVDDWLVTHSPG